MARTTASRWAAASGACCETCTRCEGKRSLAGSGTWWRTTLERNERPNARPARKERVFDRPDPACPAAAGRPGTAGGALLAATRGTRSRHESERLARLPAWSDSPQRETSRPPNVGQFVRLLNELAVDLSPKQALEMGQGLAALLVESYEIRRLSPPRWVRDLVRHYESRPRKAASDVA